MYRIFKYIGHKYLFGYSFVLFFLYKYVLIFICVKILICSYAVWQKLKYDVLMGSWPNADSAQIHGFTTSVVNYFNYATFRQFRIWEQKLCNYFFWKIDAKSFSSREMNWSWSVLPSQHFLTSKWTGIKMRSWRIGCTNHRRGHVIKPKRSHQTIRF